MTVFHINPLLFDKTLPELYFVTKADCMAVNPTHEMKICLTQFHPQTLPPLSLFISPLKPKVTALNFCDLVGKKMSRKVPACMAASNLCCHLRSHDVLQHTKLNIYTYTLNTMSSHVLIGIFLQNSWRKNMFISCHISQQQS